MPRGKQGASKPKCACGLESPKGNSRRGSKGELHKYDCLLVDCPPTLGRIWAHKQLPFDCLRLTGQLKETQRAVIFLLSGKGNIPF